MLKFIGQEESNSDDLPWINDYLEEGGEVDDSFPVTKIVLGAKGLLVFTANFKGFIFKKSKMYDYVLEALDIWVKGGTVIHPLFAVAQRGGKLALAVDNELEDSVWLKDKNSWEQRLKKGAVSGLDTTPINPLLATSPPTTSSGRNPRRKDTAAE